MPAKKGSAFAVVERAFGAFWMIKYVVHREGMHIETPKMYLILAKEANMKYDMVAAGKDEWTPEEVRASPARALLRRSRRAVHALARRPRPPSVAR